MEKILKYLLFAIFLMLSWARAEELQKVVVKPGDTLWSIAEKYLNDPTKWNELLKYNQLPAGGFSIALPGTTLKVPVHLVKERYRAARLTALKNKVLFRKSGAVDWNPAAAKMELYKGDYLRTNADARAELRFILDKTTEKTMTVYPKSMIVISPPGAAGKNADALLRSGALRGTNAKVLINSATITPGTKDTEFYARIDKDMNTRVQVNKGRATVEALGRKVEVFENFVVEVRRDMPPSRPVELPPAPELDEPAGPRSAGDGFARLKIEDNVISLNTLPAVPGPDISGAPAGRIKVQVLNPVQSYHIQVSRDRDFSSFVWDRTYDALEMVDLGVVLPPGAFWLRVSCIDLMNYEGRFTAPREITIADK